MMKGSARAGVFAAAVLLCVIFSGCAPKGGETQPELRILAKEGDIPDSILEGFEKKNGVTILLTGYKEEGGALANLAVEGEKAFDLASLSDDLVAAAREKGLLGELGFSSLSNAGNADPAYLNGYYDPEGKYALPYAASALLILFDPSLLDRAPSDFEDLWDKSYADSVVLPDDARGGVGIALKAMGRSFNEKDRAVLAEAEKKLAALKPNIRLLDSLAPQNSLENSHAKAVCLFTSQAAEALALQPALAVRFPEGGSCLQVDCFAIPKNARHADMARAFLNYVLEAETGAKLSGELLALCLNKAAEPLLSKEYRQSDAIRLTGEHIDLCEPIRDAGGAEGVYEEIWTSFKSK